MTFENVASAYNFYRNLNVDTMESRSKAIQAEISGNPDADIQSLAIELEAIENALVEKRSATSTKKPEKPGFTATVEKTDNPASSAVYRSAFYKHMLGNDMSGEEKRVFEQVNTEKRADAFNNLSNSAAVVPTKLLDSILVKARDQGGILSISRGFNMPANIRIPIATPGSAAQWHTEGTKVESEQVNPSYVEFGANEIMKVLSMSVAARTMTIDAFESYLADELTASIMACLAQTAVDGDGVKKGTGILTGITWVDDENQLTIPEEDWFDWKMFTRAIAMLHRGYSNGAKFVMNNATLYNDIISLHDDNNRPVYVYDIQNATTGHLLGFPVVIDDYMADHDILFGNFNFYGYNIPQGIMLDVSRESSFKSGLVDYRAMAVADCKPIIEDAFIRLVMGE